MDLRSVLNSDGGSAPKPQRQPPKNQQPPPPPIPPSQLQHLRQPSTPVSTVPPHSFRDYSQSAQVSPGRHYSHEYASQPTPTSAGAYGRSPPPSYHQVPGPTPPVGQGPYASGPAPPPLQPLSSDLRSPSAASTHRPTPTSSVSNASGGYFPVQGTPMSPVARHQYPPTSAYPPRDNYSQPGASPHAGMAGPPGPPGPSGPPVAPGGPLHLQGTPMPPQTPPVGTPGSAHPYIHQHSQSAQSTPTPTSAQSQYQYGTPFVHGSPIVASHSLPPADHARQPSQPSTPLGPPLSAGNRQSQGPSNYMQPSSPYQQRLPSSAGSYHLPTQTSPHPPPPPSIPRMPSNHVVYDPHLDSHRRSRSQSERDRSLSVSPKTRIPSLTSNAGRPSSSVDSEPHHFGPNHASMMESERDRAVTPAKRKLEDRDLAPDELDRREARPPPFAEVNGSHIPSKPPPPPPPPPPPRTSRMSSSPVMLRQRRHIHTTPPIWAQRVAGKRLNAPNFVLRNIQHHHINGKPDTLLKAERVSPHASPEVPRSSNDTAPVQAPTEDPKISLLGPWEPSLMGTRPYDDIPKKVADWLFINVVNNPDMGEIKSRGVQFEIEAKLGTIISKDTNDRIDLPVGSECLMRDDSRIAFRSSMTEAQHQAFNEYLNSMVVDTDPRNPDAARLNRVQIHYKHRREIDKFYELPLALMDRLPVCVRSLLPSKRGLKVRVTYDQKTQEPLAQIVKARVGDMSLHFPDSPLDCRISINLEMAWDGPVQEIERLALPTSVNTEKAPDRNKDRLSYSQSHYQVDLTQVTQSVPGPNKAQREVKEHELEIELAPAIVIDHGTRATQGLTHQYQELVEGLIDNVRLLARKAHDFSQRRP